MLDIEKIGRQIALLRKEKGYTGEKLAELLGVSPQAISKWENGKCLPDTVLLPELAKAFDCSIDTLLVPKELIILEAVYTDGITTANVTQVINNHIHDNKLNVCVNGQFIGAAIESDRVKLLTVKYQISSGTYFAFALQNENLVINATAGQTNDKPYKLIGAYYGNAKKYASAMEQMEHHEYFKWDSIHVSCTVFPSNTASDETEYLTLVYLNKSGVHAISCAENDVLYYGDNRTSFYLKDNSTCILPDVTPLIFDKMPCTWAGAIYAALKYMGEPYSYEQVYGMSGACFRVCFCDIWDWSATDALVTYWYDMPLYNAIGYEQIWANRLEKEERKEERKRIVADILHGKPIPAVNLRVTHEWGVITGYKDNGDIFYCQTYYDKNGNMINENGSTEYSDYLEADNWPFLICHFGDKKEKPSALEILYASLRSFIEGFEMKEERGYYSGRQAYEKWIEGLNNDALWDERSPDSDIARRFDVNLWTMFHLVDARRCAADFLSENASLLTGEKAGLLAEMAKSYREISEQMRTIKDAILNRNLGNSWRFKQIELLEWILSTENDLKEKAKKII